MDDIGDLEKAIAEFKAALPGWWFTTGTCSVSCDASIGPDRAYIAEPILTIFDEGIDADLPQPSTAAEALRNVTARAVEALKDPQAYAIANPLYRDRLAP
jgi:hypothetical protein